MKVGETDEGWLMLSGKDFWINAGREKKIL